MELKSSTSNEGPDPAETPLPPVGATCQLEDGTVVVGVGGVGRSTKAIVPNSFSSCTPLIAKFDDGSVGLYHAASTDENDPNREYLLKAQPTDVFVITKDGFGAHTGRQSAQAIDTIEQAFPETSVHIVTLPRATLSVEARPGKIVIRDMPIRQYVRESNDTAISRLGSPAGNPRQEDNNGAKDISEFHPEKQSASSACLPIAKRR